MSYANQVTEHPMTTHEVLLMNSGAHHIRKMLVPHIVTPEAQKMVDQLIEDFYLFCEKNKITREDDSLHLVAEFLVIARRHWRIEEFDRYINNHARWWERIFQNSQIKKERSIMEEFVTAIQKAINKGVENDSDTQ